MRKFFFIIFIFTAMCTYTTIFPIIGVVDSYNHDLPLHNTAKVAMSNDDANNNTNVPTATFNVTLVTAFYDIQRADRNFEDYLIWIKKTLLIPHPFVIFCHSMHESAVREARSVYMNMTTIVLEDKFPLEGLSVLVGPMAQRVGAGRQSPEWTNAKYIPIQFSKFSWLNKAIALNPYHTTHVYWIDAGISRFFREGQPLKRPLEVLEKLTASGFSIMAARQFTPEFMQLRLNDVQIGSQINYFMGGFFGGSIESVRLVSYAMIAILTENMMAQGIVDNEQIGFAILYTHYRNWFHPLFWHDFEDSASCDSICL